MLEYVFFDPNIWFVIPKKEKKETHLKHSKSNQEEVVKLKVFILPSFPTNIMI
jgi:hypothetical protein